MPVTILGLSGSLRRASLNTALLRTAADRAPDGVRITILPLGEVPMYDGDLEADQLPAPVTALREAVEGSDGLLLAFPEYNWSVPAVLKNALDWASRGGSASPLHRKPTAMMSAAGGSGGARAQAHMTDILGHSQVALIGSTLQVPRAREHIVDGALQTPRLLAQMDAVISELADRARVLTG